jgi:recombination protein RecA
MGSVQVGLQARLMSQALRKLTAVAAKSNTVTIFINQLREKISTGFSYGPSETTPGGRALKFYASVRLDVRRTGKLEDDSGRIGNKVKVKVVKNKVAPPFKEADFDIIYGSGISKSGDIIDHGVKFGLIKQSGAWFYCGEEKLGQGRERAKRFLEENPTMMSEIEAKIKAAAYACQ